MRGLSNFITEIRACQNKESEIRRCANELAKIRKKFSKKLSGYDSKKYLWKLMFMQFLGYEIDFGHNEARKLMASKKFSEKFTAYMFTSEFFGCLYFSVVRDRAG